MAILRGLGTKHGLYFPTDPRTSYFCDVIVDTYGDAFESVSKVILPVLTAKGGKADDGDQAQIKEAWKKSHVPLFKIMCANMRQHGGKYAAGNRLTIADCVMVAGMANIWQN